MCSYCCLRPQCRPLHTKDISHSDTSSRITSFPSLYPLSVSSWYVHASNWPITDFPTTCLLLVSLLNVTPSGQELCWIPLGPYGIARAYNSARHRCSHSISIHSTVQAACATAYVISPGTTFQVPEDLPNIYTVWSAFHVSILPGVQSPPWTRHWETVTRRDVSWVMVTPRPFTAQKRKFVPKDPAACSSF